MTAITLTPKASAEVRRYRRLLDDAPGEKTDIYLRAIGATVSNDLNLQDARAGKCRLLSPDGAKCTAIEEDGCICPYSNDDAVPCTHKHDLPADMQELRRILHAHKAAIREKRDQNTPMEGDA